MIPDMNPLMIPKHLLALVAACALSTSLSALAAGEAPLPREPEGVVSLNSSATVQVPNDWLAVQFSVTKQGTDAASVQAALKEALGTALAQARQVAKPEGHVEVQGGGFSLQPRLNPKGVVTGWTGTTQLWVQGRDMPAIADLAGRISSMTVGGLTYSVSREAREKVEADVAAQAIARFRAKASSYAKAFGYADFVVREVNVQTDGGQPPSPRMFAMKASSAMADDSLPVEAGTGTVTTNVNGTVQMK
jgi:predicted secreted protein